MWICIVQSVELKFYSIDRLEVCQYAYNGNSGCKPKLWPKCRFNYVTDKKYVKMCMH